MAETLTTAKIISKIVSISFSHFRGFKNQGHKINTNADLVLISGPNGYGKSSFLEGLLLVLTGWHGYGSTEELLSLPAINHNRADSFKIDAEFIDKINNKDSDKISIEWSKDSIDGLNLPVGLPGSRLGADPELEARLCGFFQDRVDMLFDQASRGLTLRDIYEPLPERQKNAIEFIKRSLPEQIEAKKSELVKPWTGKPIEILISDIKKAWERFIDLFREYMKRSENEAIYSKDIEDERDIKEFVVKVLKLKRISVTGTDPNLLNKLKEALIGEVRILIDKAQQKAKGERIDPQEKEIQDDLEKIDQEITEINKNHPDLKKQLALFRAKDPGDPGMEDVFRSLFRNASDWSRIDASAFCLKNGKHERTKRLKRVLEEYEAVLPVEARKCLDEINEFLSPLKALEQRLIFFENEKKKKEKELSKFRISAEAQELINLRNNFESSITKHLNPALEAKEEWNIWNENQKHKIKAVKFLEDIEKIGEEALIFLENIAAPSEDIMRVLTEIGNQVMRRFALVDGFLPLKLEKFSDEKGKRNICRIKTNDDRELVHFSTGQRSQTAVAFLTAQNLAVSDMLTHRIIILDDVTTSYDLSNLTREALLWRQLAYGMEGNQARQVFISSHHEDLTNHLLDLLIPPEGRSMRLLKFEGWTPENGPDIKFYDVTPTRSAMKDDVRKEFAGSLKEIKW